MSFSYLQAGAVCCLLQGKLVIFSSFYAHAIKRSCDLTIRRCRPGEYSYENQYTKERLAFAPTEPSKPSQYSFRAAHGPSAHSAITVTRESLQLQHQKAVLAQGTSNHCGGICSCSIQ